MTIVIFMMKGEESNRGIKTNNSNLVFSELCHQDIFGGASIDDMKLLSNTLRQRNEKNNGLGLSGHVSCNACQIKCPD